MDLERNPDEIEEYLRNKMQGDQEQGRAAYDARLATADRAADRADQSNLMAGLLSASSKFGSLGGRVQEADTKPLLAQAQQSQGRADDYTKMADSGMASHRKERSLAAETYIKDKKEAQLRQSAFDAKKKEKEEERVVHAAEKKEQREWQDGQNDLNRTAAGQRAMTMSGLSNARYQDRVEEKQDALHVPGYGEANTPDDAKQLKSGVESKKNFDRKLSEMIDLRESKNGGAFFDREAVQRGEQLSKDVFLIYKDMVNLGVLSKSDQEILDAIIPSDPLEYNFSGLVGQDPTMHRLKKFKEDTEADFQTRLGTRLKGYKPAAVAEKPPATDGSTAMAAPAGKTETRRQHNKALNKTRVTYSDGTVEDLDGIK